MEKPIYKTVSIRANMAPVMKEVTKNRQIGTKTIKKTKGVFKKEEYEEEQPIFENYKEMVPTGEYSDTSINIEEFSEMIMKVCNDLHSEGYDVINMSDIIDGRYQWDTIHILSEFTGYGFGYSVTDGMIVTAKLKDV